MADLKKFRRDNNLSQEDLSNFLGVSIPFISQIETGKRDIPEHQLSKLLLNRMNWDVTALKMKPEKKIPLYDDAATIGGNNDVVANVDNASRVAEYVDAGDWFQGATSAIYHYGDSMVEYPSGSILALKRVDNPRLLVNGEHYVIETSEFRVTKQIIDKGEYIMAYSTNQEKYPDGELIHAPFAIPKEEIRHMDLVLGCVIKKFSNPIKIK